MFEIGKRIIELRSLYKMSANRLSICAGVDPSTINKIEKGTAKPSIDLVFKICEVFDIALNQFFNDQPHDLPPEIRELVSECKELPPDKVKVLIASAKAMK